MLKVGITGGIGSGKSVVRQIFGYIGIPVYDADSEAKKLLNTEKEVKEALIGFFGTQIYPDGLLDKAALARIIFSDKEAISKVNSVVHPAVRKHFAQWLESNSTYPYCIKEAAILFESGAHNQLDKVIVVDAPIDVRIQRVLKRDQTTESEIRKRMANQMPADEKRKLADYIVINDGTQSVVKQVLKLHKTFLKIAQGAY